MSTYGIFDYDFMNYNHVIPNLECGKLLAFLRSRHHIAVLTPNFNPKPYANYIVRKEYEDYQDISYILKDNITYGGGAFSNQKFHPLDKEIEYTTPTFDDYFKFLYKYGNTKTRQIEGKSVINSMHMRISLDETTIDEQLVNLNTFKQDSNSLIFHDRSLHTISGAVDYITELLQSRRYVKNMFKIYPYKFGNKFPIKCSSIDELTPWLQLPVMPSGLNIQYNKLFDDEELVDLILTQHKSLNQLTYDIGSVWSEANHFIANVLPKIFKQVLFLRSNKVKILLTDEENKITNYSIRVLLDVLSRYACMNWKYQGSLTTYTLDNYLKNKVIKNQLLKGAWYDYDDIRNSFYLIQKQNYELFCNFYQQTNVILKGGKFHYV